MRDVGTVDALLAAYPGRTLYCLRAGELLGPLEPAQARELAANQDGVGR
jgi:hypothetical protein